MHRTDAGRTNLNVRFQTRKRYRRSARRSVHGPLSAREREVLGYLAEGLSGAAIAERLVLSPETVRTHVRNAMEKLGASTRSQAVALALESGVIGEPAPREAARARARSSRMSARPGGPRERARS